MRASPHRSRKSRIERLRSRLVSAESPRLQMTLIVMLTGAAGALASFTMLHSGVESLGLRYFFAMCAAYVTFLFMLWVWLRSRQTPDDGIDAGDALDLASSGIDLAIKAPRAVFDGAGGTFDGAGASGDYVVAALDVVDEMDLESPSTTVAEAAEAIGSADDLAIPLAVIALIGALVLSSVFVIWSAPVLFAELLVDGVIAASLYRRLQGLDKHHWLETALRRTFWPFVLTTVVVTGAGWAMGQMAPGARSLGEVLRYQPGAEQPAAPGPMDAGAQEGDAAAVD